MKANIKGGHAFSYVEVELAPGESIMTEPDAMSSMDASLDLTAHFNGGLIKGLLRKYLGGESLFISRFHNATSTPRSMTIVQPTPGEVLCKELNDEVYYMQPGAFLACEESVKIGLGFAGFASWIAREGLFRIKVSGHGKVWFGAYGALLEKEVNGEYIVDTSHLVAYDPSLRLNLQLAGGLFSSFFGGEGLVTRVSGKGKIIIQTRSISSLASWLNPKL
ncbi:TIGR00266 family protein [Undibacterium sp. YM2]|uniref:TIGR00266 family protein n=1 Tax=Undibacterium sp. YM2 TaxID=2058625 RepID=UPI001331DAF9|nr:TIGR00266 family protein [Undibacterium sp. YM2]BBB70114.1 TIGR00266 family protein [Undibacterium sp. YM2]